MQPIAIACGDPAGIGPEVALKAVAQEAREGAASVVLIGDRALLAKWNERLRLGLDLRSEPGARLKAIQVIDPRAVPLNEKPVPYSPAAAMAAIEYLRVAGEGCREGRFSAMVTAPLNKEAVLRAGVPFVGQTEFLSDLCDRTPVTMMLLGHDSQGRWLRVSLVTTHLPLRDVAGAISEAEVLRTILHSAAACKLLRLARCRIAVCGLNPHAGEGGLLGDEEKRVIEPAIRSARERGIDVVGPVSGDTAFHEAYTGGFDAVVAMYHDQGLPPLKLVAFETGVNWTLGLPFVRTSPDHGTAYGIAGQGVADPSSMVSALRLARRLSGSAPSIAPEIEK